MATPMYMRPEERQTKPRARDVAVSALGNLALLVLGVSFVAGGLVLALLT